MTTDARPIVETGSGHVLDNIVWESLVGPNRHLGEIAGLAARYDPQVAAFAGIAEDSPQAWADLAGLLGPAGTCFFTSPRPVSPPVGWEILGGGEGVQMVDAGVVAVPDADVAVLGADDVPEILDLVARTRPGPFEPRTIEMGTYLGIRAAGQLVAMAGERNHPRGWTEISAVCTDSDFRGQGLAARLVRAVTYGINQRGERALLHASGTNENAIRLYRSLGFALRRTTNFAHLRAPG